MGIAGGIRGGAGNALGGIQGGTPGTNIVAEHCTFLAEARSLDPAKAEAMVSIALAAPRQRRP